jgi:hypothetical protein
MTAILTQAERVDIELAVAMEIGNVRLERAVGTAAREAAVAYNVDLWRSIGHLAATMPLGEEGDALEASAALVTSRPSADLVAERNRAHARALAGRIGTHGSLRRLLDQWRDHLGGAPKADFGRWLLERLDARSEAMPVTPVRTPM